MSLRSWGETGGSCEGERAGPVVPINYSLTGDIFVFRIQYDARTVYRGRLPRDATSGLFKDHYVCEEQGRAPYSNELPGVVPNPPGGEADMVGPWPDDGERAWCVSLR